MTFNRALKIAIAPWIVGSASFIFWLLLNATVDEIVYLSWRMGIALIAFYFGLAFAIYRINEILARAGSFRR